MNQNWKNSTQGDSRLFKSISILFENSNQHIPLSLFSKTGPKLIDTPENILKDYNGICSSDYILVKVALDIWSGSGNVYLWEILESLDLDNIKLIIKAILYLKTR